MKLLRIPVLLLSAAALILPLKGASPWDAWRQGYTKFEQGGELRDKGNYSGALQAFREAREHYLSVRRQRPDWNQKVIAERIADCERECAKVEKLLGGAEQQTLAAAAPSAGETFQKKTAEELRTRLADAEARAKQQSEQQRRDFESEIAYLMRDQRIAREKYALLERRYKQLETESRKPNAQLAEVQNHLLEERMRADQLARQLELASGRMRQLEENRRDASIARSAAEKELQRREEQIQRLSGELQLIQQQSGRSSEKEQQLLKRVKQAEEQRAKAEKALTELGEKLQRIGDTQEGTSADMKKLQGKNSLLEKSLDLAQQQKLDLEKRLNTSEHSLSRVSASLQGAEAEKVRLNAENAKLRRELEQERGNARAAAGELKNLRETGERLASDLKQALARGEELSRRLNTRESSDFQNLTSAKESITRLNEELARLQNDLVASRAAAETAKERAADLERKLRASGDESRKLNASLIAVQDRFSAAERELKQLRGAAGKLAALEKNFQALQAENKENRLAAEAAKPREAELERIKLRLAELEQLKADLAREQRLNGELNSTLRRLQAEQTPLRARMTELDKAKRELASLDALKKELERMKKINTELAEAKAIETEIAALKIRLADAENRASAAAVTQKELKMREEQLVLVQKTLSQKNQELQKLRSGNAELSALQSAQQTEFSNRSRQNEEKIRQLQQHHKAELEARALELAAAQNALASVRKELQQRDTEQQIAAGRAAEQKRQYEELQTRLKEREQAFQTLQQQLSALQKEQKESQEKLAQKEKEAAGAAELQQEIAGLRKALAQEKEKMQLAVSREHAKSGKPQQDDELLQLREKLQLLQQSKDAQEKESKATRQELVRLKQSISEQTARLSESSRQLADQNVKVAEQAQKLSDAVQKEKAQSKKLADNRATLEALQNEYQKQSRELAGCKNELLLLKGNLVRLRESAESAEIREKNAGEELLRLRKLAGKLAPLNDQIARLQEEHAQALSARQGQLDELNRRSLQQQNRLQLLEGELARLKKLNSDLARAQTLAGELAEAKLQLAGLERLRDELARVTRLNTALTAERDKFAAEKDQLLRNGGKPELKLAGLPAAGHPDDLTAAGALAEADGNEELAIWNYRQALKAAPQHTAAAKRLGLLQFARSEYAEAAVLLSTARSANPSDLPLTLAAARAYIGAKRFGNARAIIEPVLKQYPDNADVQLAQGLILAGSGQSAKAEERLLLAARLAPRAKEPRLALARLLAGSVSDRTSEAVRQYEAARDLGAAPDPALEKKLGKQLDHRRDVSAFLSSAASEAARSGDWHGAAWYYRQLLSLGRETGRFVPRLAFAYYMQNSHAGVQETLEFQKPSRLGMAVLALSQIRAGELEAAEKSAMQARGAEIPADWPEFKVELDRVVKGNRSRAADLLRHGIR